MSSGETEDFENALVLLPEMISSRDFDGIETILGRLGSLQLATNFRDTACFFHDNSNTRKIVEIGVHNFASAILVNTLKDPTAEYYGFDNWDFGGPEACKTAKSRCARFPNAHVETGHPMDLVVRSRHSSSLPSSLETLTGTDLLIIDGNHSFLSTLADCACMDFLIDGAGIMIHDCGLGKRIWGCFWVYFLMMDRGIIEPSDDRFDVYLRAIECRNFDGLEDTMLPEIEYAVGRFRKDKYLQQRDSMSKPSQLWTDVCRRFGIRYGLDISQQSHKVKELFGS